MPFILSHICNNAIHNPVSLGVSKTIVITSLWLLSWSNPKKLHFLPKLLSFPCADVPLPPHLGSLGTFPAHSSLGFSVRSPTAHLWKGTKQKQGWPFISFLLLIRQQAFRFIHVFLGLTGWGGDTSNRWHQYYIKLPGRTLQLNFLYIFIFG